jgi:hypothetical protein
MSLELINQSIYELTSQIDNLKLEKTNMKNEVDEELLASIENKIKCLQLDKELMQQYDESTNECKYYYNEPNNLEIQYKYLPLEVHNTYCSRYFDDEDFIYTKLVIPNIVLDELCKKYNIIANDLIDIIDYMKNDPLKEDEDIDNYGVMIKILYIYSSVLKYYNHESWVNESTKLTEFDTELFNDLNLIIKIMKEKITFNTEDEAFQACDKIYQEIAYGLHLIMNHMKILMNHYKKYKCGLENFSFNHRNRFIRLLNNFCVIMIYLKFNIVDLKDYQNIEEFARYNLETEDDGDDEMN